MKTRHALTGIAAGALLLVGAGGAAAQAAGRTNAGGATELPQTIGSTTYDISTYKFMNDGLCLDADTGTLHAKTTKVQLWSCNGQEQQHWVFHPVSGKPYVYTITNVGGDDKCLDADTGTIGHNGTIVHLYPCDNWIGQQWYISHPDEDQSILYLQNKASSRFLDAASEKAGQNGDPVQLWEWNGGRISQAWGAY